MQIHPNTHGTLAVLTNTPHPSTLSAWNNQPLTLSPEATHYGFVQSGTITLQHNGLTFPLTPGMYFTIPGQAEITPTSPDTTGVITTRHHHHGIFQLGGPVENTGRLRYIDGCTDTLLIPPTILGDPCLNLLHIPPHTAQSSHTHPSHRTGIIISGQGTCVTPTAKIPLTPGDIFHIPENSLHAFHTTDADLRVIAYHPDSDFGPTHQNHPMINKTILPSTKP